VVLNTIWPATPAGLAQTARACAGSKSAAVNENNEKALIKKPHVNHYILSNFFK
jgi:hypothetical protein